MAYDIRSKLKGGLLVHMVNAVLNVEIKDVLVDQAGRVHTLITDENRVINWDNVMFVEPMRRHDAESM